jgi:hypothetical protein
VFEWKTQATNLKMVIVAINVFLPLGKGARNSLGPARSGPISRCKDTGDPFPEVSALGQ